MLQIAYHDIQRATLPFRSGNEGWIGVSPDGSAYHIVVPVDRQIAKGVMACNLPTDGTPFGGYSSWLYFPCPNYDDDELDPEHSRAALHAKAGETAEELVKQLAAYGIQAEIEDDGYDEPDIKVDDAIRLLKNNDPNAKESSVRDSALNGSPTAAHCPKCGQTWSKIGRFLRDPNTSMDTYHVCADDFRQGDYVFSHNCGGTIRVRVRRFGRSKHQGKSLVGSHACPGYCHYDSSTAVCSAVCEGSVYRRIARKLRSY